MPVTVNVYAKNQQVGCIGNSDRLKTNKVL